MSYGKVSEDAVAVDLSRIGHCLASYPPVVRDMAIDAIERIRSRTVEAMIYASPDCCLDVVEREGMFKVHYVVFDDRIVILDIGTEIAPPAEKQEAFLVKRGSTVIAVRSRGPNDGPSSYMAVRDGGHALSALNKFSDTSVLGLNALVNSVEGTVKGDAVAAVTITGTIDGGAFVADGCAGLGGFTIAGGGGTGAAAFPAHVGMSDDGFGFGGGNMAVRPDSSFATAAGHAPPICGDARRHMAFRLDRGAVEQAAIDGDRARVTTEMHEHLRQTPDRSGAVGSGDHDLDLMADKTGLAMRVGNRGRRPITAGGHAKIGAGNDGMEALQKGVTMTGPDRHRFRSDDAAVLHEAAPSPSVSAGRSRLLTVGD